MHIGLAETEAERQAIYRLRYDVYVEEMGRYRGVADHDRRMLYEDVDAQSRISYIEMDGDIVATARLTWGGDAALPQRMIDQYSLSPFLAELPAAAIAVGERAMVRPHLRGTDLLLKLMCNGISWMNEHRIQLIFGDCEPHLLNLYLGLGQRTYSRTNINSPEAGYLIPIVTVVEDIEHFRRVGSPLLPYLRDFGADARVPACIQRAFAGGPRSRPACRRVRPSTGPTCTGRSASWRPAASPRSTASRTTRRRVASRRVPSSSAGRATAS